MIQSRYLLLIDFSSFRIQYRRIQYCRSNETNAVPFRDPNQSGCNNIFDLMSLAHIIKDPSNANINDHL